MSWQSSKLVDEVANGPIVSTAAAIAVAAAAAATPTDRPTITTPTAFLELGSSIHSGKDTRCYRGQRPWSTGSHQDPAGAFRSHQGPPGVHAYTYTFSRALIYAYAYWLFYVIAHMPPPMLIPMIAPHALVILFPHSCNMSRANVPAQSSFGFQLPFLIQLFIYI